MNSTHPPTEIFDFARNGEPVRESHPNHVWKEQPMGALRLAETHAAEPIAHSSEAAQLRSALRGELVLPGDRGYAQARRVWNGMVDKRPAAIVYCAGSEDVIAAVNFARAQKLLVAVRAGGH